MLGATVPEAAVHEDSNSRAKENQIYFSTRSWEEPSMKAVAKAAGMEARSKRNLDRSIAFLLGPHAGPHVLVRCT